MSVDSSTRTRTLRWIGGPTFELTLGRLRVLSDPMFSAGPEAFFMNGHPSTGAERAPIARAGPVPHVTVAGMDLILVSHLHSDHFDREAREHLPSTLPLVAPTAQVARLTEWGFHAVTGLAWWDSWECGKEDERLEITAVPARHAVDDDANEMLGIVNGYVLTHHTPADRFSLYWTGDTVWFDGLGEIRRRTGRHDLLIPHIGAVGRGGPWGRMTLDAEEAARLMGLFEEATTAPVHHHTFSHYVEPVQILEDRLRGTPEASRLVVLREGDEVPLRSTRAVPGLPERGSP